MLLRTIVLTSLALMISSNNAKAEWIELQTKDPFGEDFRYVLRADEISPNADSGFAPRSIVIKCEERRFSMYIISPADIGSSRVRYKFDDDPVAKESWQKNLDGDVLSYFDENSDFFRSLMTKDKLIIELGGFLDSGGHAIFSGLRLGQEEVRQRFGNCEE